MTRYDSQIKIHIGDRVKVIATKEQLNSICINNNIEFYKEAIGKVVCKCNKSDIPSAWKGIYQDQVWYEVDFRNFISLTMPRSMLVKVN